jgi:parallel beta-helix repeat protein
MFKERVAILISVVLLLIAPHAQASGLSIGTGSQIALNDGSLNVGGDVAITGTLTVGSGSLSLIGNWSNSGTFTPGTGTVTFNGTNQSVSGATTFYNLTKNVTSAATLTFQNSDDNRTTITNIMDLQGASGRLLSLRSDSAGTQWEIDPRGTRTVQYLNVKDSKNVSATNINAVGNNCTDSGNNTKWSFTQLTSETYYVNIASGNDSNNGSSANPWKTFHYAIDRINNAAAGTYILIMAAGTYSTGNGESDSKLAVTQDNVTLIGETGSMPVIDGTDCGTWKTGIIIEGDNIKIRNLDVRSFSETGIYVSSNCSGHEINGCEVHENTTGIADNSNGCTIKGCKVYSNNDDGITSNQTTNGVITRNTVYGNGLGESFRNGIFIAACSPEVSRNKVYDNYRNISIEGWSAATTSPIVKNNLIYEVSETVEKGIYVYANHASAVVSPYIYHNTIDLCKDGIAIALGENGGTSAPQIKYNIVTNSNEVGIRNNSANPTVTYNDVWNTQNYSGFEVDPSPNILSDPKYASYSLQSDSPCIDAIPTGADPGDPVTMDYLGYSRPQGSGFDMGAYEYIATKTYPDTLPGGTGVETDYRIFTVPLNIGTGQDMRNTMEGTLGSYAQTHWRVFARTTSGDVEMNTQAFTSLDIKPGMGFWLITVYTNTINFQGTLAPDAIYYEIELAPGWHLFAVPWPDTSIELGRIYVTDGVNQYTITDASNTLTQKYIWDYTGTGPSSGYVERSASDFSLVAGTGYFIKILGSSNITLSIPPNNSSNPPNNSSVSTSHSVSIESLESVRLPDDSELPPLPTGSYGPMPNIKANGESGPLTVSRGTPVSVEVSLDPGNRPIEKADWWVTAHTPFLPPNNWYSYVYPDGWKPGIHVCVQTLPFQVPPSFEVLNMILPTGDYKFYFAVDENADGIVDETWVDSVDVRVE